MLKQKHEITFELHKLIHCISKLNAYSALRKARFSDKLGPHVCNLG